MTRSALSESPTQDAGVGASRTVSIGRDLPLVALGLSAAAWTALLIANTSEGGSRLHDSSMAAGTTVGSTVAFLGAWELMTIAMMLPSSLVFLALFRAATRGGGQPAVRRIAISAGYGMVWAGAGAITVAVSGALARIESVGAWLQVHPNVLAGGALLLAGVFQFTGLKRRCLAVCSHPASFFMRHYRRGVGNALILGVRYGLACVGCCWALMAVMVVVGGNDLYLMAALTAVMFAERVLGWERRFVTTVGLTCFALGAFLAAAPGVMPALLTHNAEGWVNMEFVRPLHLGWCHA